jgi:hypothetical protein
MRGDGWSDKETDDPVLAEDRNFHKVEKWTTYHLVPFF